MTAALKLLGKFGVTRDGQPVDLRSRKAQALLIHLALTGKPQAREQLATLLWGDRLDHQARRSLRQALFAVRKALGPDVIVGEAELSINSAAIKVDTDASFRAIEEMNVDWLDCYTGDLAENFPSITEAFDGWLQDRRAVLRDDVTRVIAFSADRHLKNLQYTEALQLCDRLLLFDPLHEAGVRTAMQSLASLNRRTEALSLYQKFTNRLERELDAEPARETTSLAESLRSPAATVTAGSNAMRNEPHIVVAPFEDLGGGDATGFFSRELPSTIAAQGTTSGWISITSPMALEEKLQEGLNPLQAARDFGAEVLLTGTVRQIGSKVRVATQAIDVRTANPVWDHVEYIEEDDAFEGFELLSKLILNGGWHALRSIDYDLDVVDRLRNERNSPDAFLVTIQNIANAIYIREHSRRSLRYFLEATEFAVSSFPNNPGYLGTHALAVFGMAHIDDAKDRLFNYRKSHEIAKQALSLQPDGQVQGLAAVQAAIWTGRHDEAGALHERLVKSSAMAAVNGIYGTSLAFQGRSDDAISLLQQTIALESGSILVFFRHSSMAVAHFAVGKYEQAIEYARRTITGSKEFYMGHLVLIAGLQCSGRAQEAESALADFVINYRDPTVSEFRFLPFTDEMVKSGFLDALKQAGMPE